MPATFRAGRRAQIKSNEAKRVAVIGAGACGMMAAGIAARSGARVTVIEKNSRPGRKIMITGKGRCNLTNNCDVQTFIKNVPTNGKFLYSAVCAFPPSEAMAFFESLGVRLKTERGGRVFPVSDKATDVVDALSRFMKSCGCKITTDRALSVLTENGAVTGVKCEKGVYGADSVIICTGGKSYSATGSSGDGYNMARTAGHTIAEIKPSLVPLESNDPVCAEMQGLSLKNTGLKIVSRKSGKTVYTDFGEMLFTHFGMSGPMILSASSRIKSSEVSDLEARLDLKPALDENRLDERLLRDFRKNSNRNVSNSFSELLPAKMVVPVLKRWGVPFDKKCNSVTKEERRRLVRLLKCFTVGISGFRPVEEAIVTSGGVSTAEINPKTMESRLVRGLYFAGEVIDCDGYTGGFNLQIAWCTGRLAGECASS